MVPVWDGTHDHDHDHEWINPANKRRNKLLIRAKRIKQNPNKHKLFRDWYFWKRFLCYAVNCTVNKYIFIGSHNRVGTTARPLNVMLDSKIL